MARDAVAEAEKWARSLRKPRKCLTCRGGEPVAGVVKRMLVDLRNAKPPIFVSVESAYEYLVEKHGYGHSLAALREHVRRCLGVSRRVKA